jgi:protocatechuate 3,4-dioxygenase, alpha subunit
LAAGTTPSQTVGPFFSMGLAWMNRSDLTDGPNSSERFTIHGRVLDAENQPVPDALLEIWQANANGHYPCPEDMQSSHPASKFFGFGRVQTNDLGEFSFTTLKPGSTLDLQGKPQAPHLAVSVFMRGLLQRLVTRIYFPGEPANTADVVLGLVPPARRGTLIARQEETDKTSLTWDVRLQGDQETVFFDC